MTTFLSKQEIFDRAAKHLLQQNAKSMDDEVACMYRNYDGLMCAVGCLIDDKHYNVGIEGVGISAIRAAHDGITSWNEPHRTDALVKALRDSGVNANDPEICSLLHGLQQLHDNTHPDGWHDELHITGKIHKVNVEVLDEV